MNFKGNDFERFLREKADEFTLYPSQRVWYSIYNNMHPGNRLPSVSMCIVLLGVLFFTGYLNTRPVSPAAHSQQATTASINTPGSDQSDRIISRSGIPHHISNAQMGFNDAATPMRLPAAVNTRAALPLTGSTATSLQPRYTAPAMGSAQMVAGITENNSMGDAITGQEVTKPEFTTPDQALSGNTPLPYAQEPHPAAPVTTADLLPTQPAATVERVTADEFVTNPTHLSSENNKAEISSGGQPATESAGVAPAGSTTGKPETKVAAVNTAAAHGLGETDLSWIEHDVLYNRRAARKWAGKLSWQAYITPGVVYRSLMNNAAGKPLSGNGMAFFNSANLNSVVRHKPSVGMEAGLILQYDLLKKVKVKGGIQFNFTRYNALAYENHHPISTSITMNGNDPFTVYEVFRSTNYSNMVGLNEVKLHNQTFQFSLPMGLDYRLAQSGNLSWYAGATIQPSFVLFAQTYLISSDRRNYVQDASMLNRINLNAGFETYLSFKTADYSWQIGPQFRTQLFSTNNKIYSVEERLMSVGIKAGITRKF